MDYSKYFNGDRVKFEVNGKAEIVLLFQNAGNSTRDVYLETINGAILQMWTLDVDQRLIASYSYSGGVTGQGTTLGLATTGQNIRVYAIYVNSF